MHLDAQRKMFTSIVGWVRMHYECLNMFKQRVGAALQIYHIEALSEQVAKPQHGLQENCQSIWMAPTCLELAPST